MIMCDPVRVSRFVSMQASFGFVNQRPQERKKLAITTTKLSPFTYLIKEINIFPKKL